MAQHILITGCKGQLGNEIQLLAPSYPEWTFYYTDKEELDITDLNAINTFIATYHIDMIINCAAYTAVDKAESEEKLCDLLNHIAARNLAEAIAAVGGHFIHISTDYVFDGEHYLPYKEEDSTRPQTIYGETKLKGETAVFKACPEAVVIRTSWLYSAFGNNFVKTMLRLGKEKQQLGVIFDQIGTPTYAHDLAKAILNIIQQGPQAGLYHFSNEGACSWFDFTRAIHRLAGITTCDVRPLHTTEYPTAAKRPNYSVLDKTKIKSTYKLVIPWWEDSLQDCIARLLNEEA